jgi:RNA polymerase-binding transcription factor DksA
MNAARRLTKAQLRGLEDELRSERARLERSIATRMGADDAAPATVNVFRSGTQAEGGLAVALETRILDRHQMLDSALRRLQAGTYGVCVGCHNPIPYGRLLVMPEATYCVRCGAGS